MRALVLWPGGTARQQAAMHSDALLRLCVDLYSEALAEPSPDARYLRLWSLLETLSGARLPSGQPVQRLDGTAWPGQASTTSAPAPRVYRLQGWYARAQQTVPPAGAPDAWLMAFQQATASVLQWELMTVGRSAIA